VIPDPAADNALRDSLVKVKGRLLIGVINSIGVRQDANSVSALIGQLENDDADVASAAAVALGRIGGATSAKVLERSLVNAPAAVRNAVAEGCVRCAEKLLAGEQSAEAVELYDAVRKVDVPKPRILQATRGAILARGAAGIPLLVEQLQSADKALFALGLGVAREIPSSQVTDILVSELVRTTPQRQALLILALGDRNEPKAMAAVLKAAKSESEAVRFAAIRGLELSGNGSCLPVLLEAATGPQAELAETALAVLADLPGKEVDDDLAARLQKAEGKARLILIQLAGRRHIETTNPLLMKAAEDSDIRVRCAALTALGATVSLDDLPILMSRATDLTKTQEAKAAGAALCAACARMTDRDGCADKILAVFPSSPAATKCILLETLVSAGGTKALKAVSAAAHDANSEVRDAAYRALGEWTSTDAGPELLVLAKLSGDNRLATRALRGYVRIARQFNIPDSERLAMYGEILTLAKRDEEKRIALDVLKRVISAESLALAVENLDKPALQEAAARVALAISQELVGLQPAAVAKAMEKVLQVTKNKDLSARATALLERSRKK